MTWWLIKYGDIYLPMYVWLYSPLLDLGRFFSFLIMYTVGTILLTGDQPVARPLPTHRINADTHGLSGIRTHDPRFRAIEDSSCLRTRGHCDRQYGDIRKGADKSLAFPIYSTTERIFLGWVKEVRTTKS
jgi:hypothetical protein